MEKIVLDASVFIKLFVSEEGDKQARSFLKKITSEEIQIIVPEIFFYEVFAVSQKIGIEFERIIDFIDEYRNLNLITVNLDNALIEASFRLIKRYSNPKSGFPSFYDAVYHALAVLNNCNFITSDKKHYEKTKGEGFIELI